MTGEQIRSISRQGLWTSNPALVQLLGLCPLLAVSTSLVTSIGLGLATAVVLTASNGLIALIRHLVDRQTRLPLYILIIASFVTCTDMLLQAWTFELHQRISLFVALIVTNCTLLGRAESFASKNPVLVSLYDGLMMAAGFAGVLLVMGFTRELLGRGTMFANMDQLFGEAAGTWVLQVGESQQGFLLAILPPGAFFLLGFIIALKNVLDARWSQATGTAPVTRGKIGNPELL
jgi:electron transport complex protein RnfE